MSWDDHLRRWRWEQGDHVTLIGPTKAGKTTLARAILPLRSYVVVLACKPRDPALDGFKADGYRVVRRWSDVAPRRGGDHVILWPKGKDADATEDAQFSEFRTCLNDLYQTGGWTLYLDEATYLTDYLGMERPLKRLWRQGRTIPVSVVAAAQAPVGNPGESYDQIMHLYVWKNRDLRRQKRLTELSGAIDRDDLGAQLGRLREHEVLYVDGATGEMRRTMVDG